ncbi:MAG: hypothetical protein ACFFA3_10920 [Promethearchaeota archaeon]
MLDNQAASSIISKRDAYLNRFSKFDLQSRLGTSEEATMNDLLIFLSHQTLDWEQSEKETLEKIFSELESSYGPYEKNLPKIVPIIKTTGREECDAAYTRKNSIYIPLSMVQWPYNELKELIAHELFHVISNADLELRNDWYTKLGFTACPELQIPNEYHELYVTNPDTIGKNCYLSFQEKGKPLKAVSFLYSKHSYKGGYFFRYFCFSFLKAEINNRKCKAIYEGDTLQFIDVPQDLYDLCVEIDPYNNPHRLHPEEILAEYWSLLPFSEPELDYNKRNFLKRIHNIIE